MNRTMTARLASALDALDGAKRPAYAAVFAQAAQETRHPDLAALYLGLRAELLALEIRAAQDRDVLAALVEAERPVVDDLELGAFGPGPEVDPGLPAWWPEGVAAPTENDELP